ncbi:MAG: putative DNA binding domain-containing protein [Oscillospiraceae bacterium]|nr:putative DNA binding domain-containing protein [Oscillospiraceae bacterium]
MFTEGNTVELKKEYTDDIKKSVVAFANSNGGQLYVGVSNDGAPVGLADADGTMLQITNTIRDSIRPDVTMFTTCERIAMEGKAVILVTVQQGTARPYYLAGKGIRPEGVYVRQGASSVPATDSAIVRMIKDTNGESYEELRSLNQALTFTTLEREFREAEIPLGEAQYKTLGLVDMDGTYSNLALLLSEQCPYSIKLAVFEGDSKAVFRDRYEFEGSALAQLSDCYRIVDRYNRTRAEFDGLKRIDTREYPIEAVREALLNLIVHRDYSFGGSALVSVFDDRVEFVSLGGLAKNISIKDMLLGVSVLRNKNLANVFYRLHLIEAYGTGMPKIMKNYAGYTMQPKVEVSDNAFKITLPNTLLEAQSAVAPEPPRLTGREQDVMDLFADKESIVRRDVEDGLGVSQPMAVKLLRQLVEKGAITKVGDGKRVRYELG